MTATDNGPVPLLVGVLVPGPRGVLLRRSHRRTRFWNDPEAGHLVQIVVSDDPRRSGNCFRQFVASFGLDAMAIETKWSEEVRRNGGEEDASLAGDKQLLDAFGLSEKDAPCYVFVPMPPAVEPATVVRVPAEAVATRTDADRVVAATFTRLRESRVREELPELERTPTERFRTWLAQVAVDLSQAFGRTKVPRPRGRPRQPPNELQRRILAAWQTGRYKTYAELAAELNCSVTTLAADDVARVIGKDRKERSRRRTNPVSSG